MASLVILGVIGASVYAVAKNQEKALGYLRENRKDTDGGVSYGGFHFTRSPKSDLFSDLDSLQLDPSMPIGKGGRLPFIAMQEKDGIFGIKKILLQTPDNTLYTVYKGTMHALDV
jgi:hypothetical protein